MGNANFTEMKKSSPFDLLSPGVLYFVYEISQPSPGGILKDKLEK